MLISFSMAALPRYPCQADDAVLRLGKGSKRDLWLQGPHMASGIFASMNPCEKCLLKPN